MLPAAVQLSIASLTNSATSENFVNSFPEQSSNVAYYAVEDNNDDDQLVSQLDISDQAEILTQIMNVAELAGQTTLGAEKEHLLRSSSMIRADSLSTKVAFFS